MSIKKWLFSILIGGLTAALFVFVLKDMDKTKAHFQTYQDAIENNAIGNWLPSTIPASAHDIHESHNIDTNEMWFQFESDAWNPSLEQCSLSTAPLASSYEKGREPNFAKDWAKLYENSIEFKVFQCSERGISYTIAISEKSGKTIGWSLGDVK